MISLADLRRQRGVTQVQLAEILDIDQRQISRIERNPDLLVSSLRKYIEGLGGRLEIAAVFDEAPPVVIAHPLDDPEANIAWQAHGKTKGPGDDPSGLERASRRRARADQEEA